MLIVVSPYSCPDPERCARGGSTLACVSFSCLWGGGGFSYVVEEGEMIKIPLQAGHFRPASETQFNWCFAGVPMMASY